MLRGRTGRSRSGSATRCAFGSDGSMRLAGGWTSSGRRPGEIDTMAKGSKRKTAPATWRRNRQASFRFNLLERFESGIVLTGTEVKSLREGKAQLKDSYAVVRDGEVWLIGVYIPPYSPASRENHDPERAAQAAAPPRGDRAADREHPGARPDARSRRGSTSPGAVAGRSRSPWPRARTCTTSAKRSARARWPATSSGSCARSAAEGRSLGSRAAAVTLCFLCPAAGSIGV